MNAASFGTDASIDANNGNGGQDAASAVLDADVDSASSHDDAGAQTTDADTASSMDAQADDAALGDASATVADGAVDAPTTLVDAAPDAPPVVECGPGIRACPTGQYCDYASGNTCGLSGESGVCRPADCRVSLGESCGCNGLTYRDGCDAYAAGVDIAAVGECPTLGSCSPQSVSVVGSSGTVLGYYWTGAECEALVGTLCTGTDCASLYASAPECEVAHLGCFGSAERACGPLGVPCEGSTYCEFTVNSCGSSGELGVCTARPSTCDGMGTSLRDRVCGCDGTNYGNSCLAHMAGLDHYSSLCITTITLDGGIRLPSGGSGADAGGRTIGDGGLIALDLSIMF